MSQAPPPAVIETATNNPVIITPSNIGNFNAIQIDGQTPAGGLKWTNGNAPVASASGEDIYTFSILKTGSSATAMLFMVPKPTTHDGDR